MDIHAHNKVGLRHEQMPLYYYKKKTLITSLFHKFIKGGRVRFPVS